MARKTYEVDILALNNWQGYFINKAYNRVLRTFSLEDVASVSLRLKGDITDFRVEEQHEPGGFVYFLSDALLRSTLEVLVLTKQRTLTQQIIEIDLPIVTGRKRTADGLSKAMVDEIHRFKKAFEREGKQVYDIRGEVQKNAADITFYFGDIGYGLFQQQIGQVQQPSETIDVLLDQFTKDAIAPNNPRGQRIVKRFLNGTTLNELQLPKPKVINHVPVFILKSKVMDLYLAPTFALAKRENKVMVLYNIDKGNSVVEAAAVLEKLKIKQAKAITYLMDLRRSDQVTK